LVYKGFRIRRFIVYFMDTAVIPLIWAVFASASRPYGAWIIFGCLVAVTTVYVCCQLVMKERNSKDKLTGQRFCGLIFSIPVYGFAAGILISIGYTKMLFFGDEKTADRVYVGARIVLLLFMIWYLVGDGGWTDEVNQLTPILKDLLLIVFSIGAFGLFVLMVLTLVKMCQPKKNKKLDDPRDNEARGENKGLKSDTPQDESKRDEAKVIQIEVNQLESHNSIDLVLNNEEASKINDNEEAQKINDNEEATKINDNEEAQKINESCEETPMEGGVHRLKSLQPASKIFA